MNQPSMPDQSETPRASRPSDAEIAALLREAATEYRGTTLIDGIPTTVHSTFGEELLKAAAALSVPAGESEPNIAVLVAPELLPFLENWSEPVRVKVAKEGSLYTMLVKFATEAP